MRCVAPRHHQWFSRRAFATAAAVAIVAVASLAPLAEAAAGPPRLAAHKPSRAYRLPLTPDMPDWARDLYRDDVVVNVLELDREFAEWKETGAGEEAREAASHEASEIGENRWEEYYERWRRAVEPFVQADGSVDFARGPVRSPRSEASRVALATPSATWSFFGPRATYRPVNQDPAQPLHPWQSNIYSIDVAPSNPNIVYCGSEGGVVSRSIDNGLTWTRVGASQIASDVVSLAVHPTDPDIVYVGDRDGIYRTADGGATWALESAGEWNPEDLKINPTDPNLVFAAAATGLMRRTATPSPAWSTLIPRMTYDLAFKPGNSSIVYALVQNAAGNLCEFYKSTDGGTSFSVRSTGWIPASGDAGGRMTVTPADPNRVYVVLLTYGGPRILRSNDAGETWSTAASSVQTGLIGPCTTPAFSMTNGQGFFDLSIAASGTNADQLIVGTTTAFKSTDGGSTYGLLGGYCGFFTIHPDIQEMLSVGSDSWIATDGGITLSTDFWTSDANASARTVGLQGSGYWGFGMGWNEDVVVGGRYHNGNAAWHEAYPAGSFLWLGGGESATGYVNPANSRMVYCSDIGGGMLPAAFNQAFTPFYVTKWPNELYFPMETGEQEWDPRYFHTYYIGSANRLWRTRDNGLSFTGLFTHDDPAARVLHIEVSRVDPNVIYITVQRGSTGELWRSADAGATWTQCPPPAGPELHQLRISDLAVSGTDPNRLWWCLRLGPNGNKIFESSDGGATWTNLTTSALDGFTPTAMVHQLGTNGGIYLYGDFGAAWYRNAGMADWASYNAGLPANLGHGIAHMALQYKVRKLRLATNNGIWQVDPYENSTTTLAQPMVDDPSAITTGAPLHFESYSVVNGAATYRWSFSPSPVSVSDAFSRNPTVRFPVGAAGVYSATLTVTDDNGSTSRTLVLGGTAAMGLAAAGPVDTGPGRGVAWGDYDGDGDPDLFVANDGISSRLYRNNGSGAFTNVSPPAFAGALTGVAGAWGDYDNDGDLDLYVGHRGAPNQLFRNDGAGVFVDATVAPLGIVGEGSGVAWVDYDNDGNLDVFLSNSAAATAKLFRNAGSGGFVDATPPAFASTATAVCGVWGDYDDDGDADLFLARSGSDLLLRNDGNGAFVDVTSPPLDQAEAGNGAAWGDYDNDGDLDLYVTNSSGRSRLYRNDGGARFADVTSVTLGVIGPSTGAAWGDDDNDGHLDLVVANDGGSRLFRNDGGGGFVDVTPAPMDGHGEGVAWADYDSDGDLDLYLSFDEPANGLIRNDQSSGNHWLNVRLLGTRSNRSAIGARVRVVAGGMSRIDEISGGSAFGSQNSLMAEFGLGTATAVDSLIVRWPSGDVQMVMPGYRVDRTVVVTEGAPIDTTQPVITDAFEWVRPNPFAGSTNIGFALTRARRVRVDVFDVMGHRVTRLVDRALAAGRHEVAWNGRDERGLVVASGIYYLRLESDGLRANRKIVKIE